jgi:hypothetical protein
MGAVRGDAAAALHYEMGPRWHPEGDGGRNLWFVFLVYVSLEYVRNVYEFVNRVHVCLLNLESMLLNL